MTFSADDARKMMAAATGAEEIHVRLDLALEEHSRLDGFRTSMAFQVGENKFVARAIATRYADLGWTTEMFEASENNYVVRFSLPGAR